MKDAILKYLQDIGYKNSVILFSNHTIENLSSIIETNN